MTRKRRMIALIIAAIIILPAASLYFFFIRFVRVPTGSMANTILPGDRLIVNRSSSAVKRGDIIIFEFPGDSSIRYVSRVLGLPGEAILIRDDKVFIDGEPLPENHMYVEQQDVSSPGPLKPVREEAAAGSAWTVYHYEDNEAFTDMLEDWGGKYGAKQPFRIPVSGDVIPDELMENDKLRSVYDSDGNGRYDDDQYFCLGDNRDNSQDSRYWGTVPKGSITGKPFMIYWSTEPGRGDENRVRWDRIFQRLK